MQWNHCLRACARVLIASWAAAAVGESAAAQSVSLEEPRDNIGHRRHMHRYGEPHERVIDVKRFHTNRQGAELALPTEDDAFFFVIFGDRTGGPATGVSVLADAVRDTNLIEPDLVMTVGDLVQGYNQTEEWMAEMREFKGIMDQLLCPWFPVAGNHDVYWRGPDKPAGEHEASYEMHFGPLWYAFEHKDCWFIALYSDEGNPETGEKAFQKPEAQKMSEAQFAWLAETLDKAKDAKHVFCFLHHPRWLKGGYGDDWDRVHELLVKAGNVSAVFAGHIHYMRSDPKDGIEYVTLATVGGGQSGHVPEAGFLHQYHIVTVRDDQIAMAAIPVGETMDVREISGEMIGQCVKLVDSRPTFSEPLKVLDGGGADGEMRVSIENPADRAIDATVVLESADSRWAVSPDHEHGRIDPGATREFAFAVRRMPESIDAAFRPLEVVLDRDYLAPGFRYAIPTSRTEVPLQINLRPPLASASGGAVLFDGRDDCAKVEASAIPLPDGPLTLECWFKARSFADRVGLVAKTEYSEYGIFVSGGKPSFSVFLDERYVETESAEPILATDRWHHVAGVFDGAEIRLYVDGRLVDRTAGGGKRRITTLPMYIGADVTGQGKPMSFFDGAIDGVRLSKVARYAGESFESARGWEPDDDTMLLLNLDGQVGPWLYDASGHGAHATVQGRPELVEVD